MAESSLGLEFGSWEAVKVGGDSPSARYSQAAALLGDVVYLFGGATSSEEQTLYHGDMFALDLTRDSLEWRSIQQRGDIPSAREGASFNALEAKIYLCGGSESEDSLVCAEGFYVFTPSNETWQELRTTGPAPKAQSSSCVLHENKLITFGGIEKGKAQNYLHSLDLSTLEWSEINASGPYPPPRCDHVGVVVGSKMIVTTGSGSEELWFNDVYALDLGSFQWHMVEPEGAIPGPRDYVTINCISNKYLLQFGGFSGTDEEEKCYNELFCMDMCGDSARWHKVCDSGLPPRYAHSAIVHKNKLYILAGQDTEEELRDVWSITVKVPLVGFEPTPVPRVRYSTSVPIPAPRKVITPAPPKTPKPRDYEELRSTYLKRINEMFDTLSERFQQLDMATATLESERAAFEAEKRAHCELYERQQQEMKDMLKSHQEQNDAWVSKMRQELDNERRNLAEEKMAAEQASLELAKEQEIFQQKSKKLDAIMRQVQGLKD